jgi:hypothetical protein
MFGTLLLLSFGFAIFAILAAFTKAQQQPVAHHGRVRVHFIAAEEVEWDYVPLGRDEAMGHPFGEFEKTYVEAGGRIYKKAIYRDRMLGVCEVKSGLQVGAAKALFCNQSDVNNCCHKNVIDSRIAPMAAPEETGESSRTFACNRMLD